MSEIQRYKFADIASASSRDLDSDTEFVKLSDHLAQLRALEQRQAWQDIESCPTNQNVWVWGFKSSEGPDPSNVAAAYVVQKSSSGYFSDGRSSYGFCTHWMPYTKPAPPAVKTEAGI